MSSFSKHTKIEHFLIDINLGKIKRYEKKYKSRFITHIITDLTISFIFYDFFQNSSYVFVRSCTQERLKYGKTNKSWLNWLKGSIIIITISLKVVEKPVKQIPH